MKNKNINRIMILIILIVLAILIYEIIHIYAVFQNEVNGSVKFEKGAWNIYVNGTDITKGKDTRFTIDQINISQDNHVKPGKIAPGLNGNFNIEINPQKTSVSVRYDISIANTDSRIKIKEIKETTENKTLIKTAENTYTGVIPLEKIQRGEFDRITVYVEWMNDETKNEQDTEMGKNPTHEFLIPIQAHFEQYLGEEITPYKPPEEIK